MADDGKSGLKSAFDLAMERLTQKGDGLVSLRSDQKTELADLSRRATAKRAEIEIMFEKRIAEVKAANDEEKLKQVEEARERELSKAKTWEAQERERIRRG